MSPRIKIELDDLTANNLGILRRINSVVLPTTYGDAWYKESLAVGQLVKLAYFNDIPVGAIRCASETRNGQASIYIMTLAVLAPYRRYGVGKQLIQHIEEEAKRTYVKEVYAHVWVENGEALSWYQKVGFEQAELVEGYYRKMNPPGNAFVVRKRIE
ncbi:acyl-CoA N-acyltransferase [Lipomyces japonicus]|uniref:acyl-CoA N-acyltransferase n=1 Tax=Lipomyces japonicus TaxID=56871 RepID=UPI0034CF580D